MTDDELKQFGELAKKYEPKDKAAVLKIVQTDIHPVFQDINDGGRTAANADLKPRLDKATADLEAITTRATKAENDLKELEGKAPDATKLREKYEADLKQEREKHQAEINTRDSEVVNVRREVAKTKLVDRLADKYEVDREYASTVLVNRQDINDRIQVDKSSNVKVLKAGSTDLHIVPAEGRDSLDHLAEEVAGSVDAKWKSTKVRKGADSKSGGGGTGEASRFDAVRERAKGPSQEREAARKAGSGLDRLGGRSRAG